MVYRPRGVTLLVAVFVVAAGLGAVGALRIGAGIASTYDALLLLGLLLALGASLTPPTLLLASLFYYLCFAYYLLSVANGLWLRFSVVLASSAVNLVAGLGLLGMRRWGYLLALAVGILNVVGGLLTLPVGLISLAFGAAVVVYLSGDVKHEFT